MRGGKGARDVEKQRLQMKHIVMFIAVVACIAYLLFQARGSEQREGIQAGSEEEVRLEEVLGLIEGVGQVKVYFHYDGRQSRKEGDVLFSDYFRQQSSSEQMMGGVLVVAEGAEDVFIREQLAATISRILQLSAHRIVIVPMKKEEDVGA